MFDKYIAIILINCYISDIILKTYPNYHYEKHLAISGNGGEKKTKRT